jgi:putative sterol carrier protein
VTAWLSTEWFDEVRALGAECPDRPALSGTVQCELTGGPEGAVRCYAVFEKGRLQSGSTGKATDPDVGLTLSWDDGVAITSGGLDPNVAFMQGRLKVSGSMSLVLELLSAAGPCGSRELLPHVAAITDF